LLDSCSADHPGGKKEEIERSTAGNQARKQFSHAIIKIIAQLESQFSSNVLGIESPLWSEWCPTPARVEYQVFPRLLAVSEIGWGKGATTVPQIEEYSDFYARLGPLLARLEILDIQHASREDVDPPLQHAGLVPFHWLWLSLLPFLCLLAFIYGQVILIRKYRCGGRRSSKI